MQKENETFGKLVKEKRLKYGWSRKKLGEMVGLHESTVQRYEEGKIKKVSTDIMRTFFKALNITAQNSGLDVFDYWDLVTPIDDKYYESSTHENPEIPEPTKEEKAINSISFFMNDFGYALSNIDNDGNVSIIVLPNKDKKRVAKIYKPIPAYIVILAFITRKNPKSFTDDDILEVYRYFSSIFHGNISSEIKFFKEELSGVLISIASIITKLKNIDAEEAAKAWELMRTTFNLATNNEFLTNTLEFDKTDIDLCK